ncbi:MAG TPA: DUF4410 domain-containing protein [Rhizomicrobium sp.]
MNPVRVLCVAVLAALLAGCAGSISAPTAVTALSTEQKSALRLSDITADADAGVKMSDGDFGLIAQKVRTYIQAQSPSVFAGGPGALKMKIHFTKFDRGSAFARAMLIGLGQIVIEATVTLEDTTGRPVAEYKVAKDFAIGGVIGATTSVEDVEEGFAKSVAEVVK